MTPLAEKLGRQIRATGPMTVADYMRACLLDPDLGYYTGRDPLGAAGDFTTAPEISQMFGELLGLSLAQAWLDQGAPAPFLLAELGPGRGSLMADVLRATRAVPGFHDAMRLSLVEASPVLRAEQARRLDRFRPAWFDNLADLPDGPLFLLANEFFDALPVRQFVADGAGWRERMLTVVDGGLAFALAPPAPLPAPPDVAPVSGILETCAPAEALAGDIGARLAADGGAAIIVDYGGWHSDGDTLQSVSAHEKTGPLAMPGQADLTAHVAFGALARAAAAAGAAHGPLVAQGTFLERLGIVARARQLAAGLAEPALSAHVAAHRRLTHPQEMGQLFQGLAIHAGSAAPPPGFT